MDELLDRVTITAGVRSGQPCIRGLRVTVSDILGWLAAGQSHEQILADFPYLEADDLRAALAWAARAAERTMHVVPYAPSVCK